MFFKTDDVDKKQGLGDPNMVIYRSGIDIFFIKRNKKNAKDIQENDENYLNVTIEMAKQRDKTPDGFLVMIKGHKDAVPMACSNHLTDNGQIYKLGQINGANIYSADELGWVGEEFENANATVVMLPPDREEISVPIKFTCNNQCQARILPYRANVYKHFIWSMIFFKFIDGNMIIIDRDEKKISICDNPAATAYKGTDYNVPWSNAFLIAKHQAPEAAKYIELNMELKVKVPRDAEQFLGTYFDALLNDSKKLVQANLNDAVVKDLQKVRRHFFLIKSDEKNCQERIKIINDGHDREVSALNAKCHDLEAENKKLKKEMAKRKYK